MADQKVHSTGPHRLAVLILLTCLWSPALAQQPSGDETELPPCPESSESSEGNETENCQPPEAAESSSGGGVAVAAGSAAAVIAEGEETALTLRRILLGRSYVWFGRVLLDGAVFNSDVLDGENGFQERSLRTGLAGVLTDRLTYKAEIDLTDRDNSLSDLYVKLSTDRWGSVTVGNQRVSQNLAAMTSILSQTFMERPLPVEAFSLGRRLGTSWDNEFRRGGFHAMMFAGDPNNSDQNDGQYGFGLRGFVNPYRSGGGVFHVGASAVSQELSSDGARYRTRPESHVTDIRLVDTGQVAGAENQTIYGIELAGASGSTNFQAEFMQAQWEGFNDGRPKFRGAYINLAKMLTGEEYRYSRGRFLRVNTPSTGAWELGLRASYVDLDAAEVQGGTQLNLAVAINFYWGTRWRFMSNLIRAEVDGGPFGDDTSWILQGRVQFSW